MSNEITKKDDEDKTRCENYLETNLTKNIRILHLLKSIEEKGCAIPNDFFACRKCDGDITGGFRSPVAGETDYKPQVNKF